MKIQTAKGQAPREDLEFIRYAAEGQLEALISLVGRKGSSINVNAVDENGNTALILAAINGKGETVNFLMKMGADKELRNKKGMDALTCILEKTRNGSKLDYDGAQVISTLICNHVKIDSINVMKEIYNKFHSQLMEYATIYKNTHSLDGYAKTGILGMLTALQIMCGEHNDMHDKKLRLEKEFKLPAVEINRYLASENATGLMEKLVDADPTIKGIKRPTSESDRSYRNNDGLIKGRR